MVKSELYYNKEKYLKFKKVIESKIGHYASDLIEWDKGNRFILVVQDIYSRNIGAKIISGKTANKTLEAYKYILDKYFLNITPYKLTTDDGGEFQGSFQSYLNKCETEHKIQDTGALRDKQKKLGVISIVERTNGTIRTQLNEADEHLSSELLHKVVRKINSTVHSSTNERPMDVFSGEKIPTIKLEKHNIPNKNSAPMDFKVNQRVRITLQISKMEKNAKKKILNSRDVYKIIEKKGNKYKLNNGLWYSYTRLVPTKEPITEYNEQEKAPRETKRVEPREITTRKSKLGCKICNEPTEKGKLFCKKHLSYKNYSKEDLKKLNS